MKGADIGIGWWLTRFPQGPSGCGDEHEKTDQRPVGKCQAEQAKAVILAESGGEEERWSLLAEPFDEAFDCAGGAADADVGCG